MKRRLYMVQVNGRYGENVYLPYSVGLLWAYARTFPEIAAAYDLCDFLYEKEPVERAVARLDQPDLIAISCYIWNWEWSRAFSRAVKAKWPGCTIIVGGVQVQDESPEVLVENPFFDFAIYGEGEAAFADFLIEHATNERIYSRVGSLIWRSPTRTVSNPRRVFTDLAELRSPYLDGVFDFMLSRESRWQVLQETTRGCLARGSIITTDAGERKIEDIRPGECVLGWDENRNIAIWNTVEKSICTGTKRTLQITSRGGCVEVTDDHPIFTQRGWVAAGLLTSGDKILCRVPTQTQSPWVCKDVLGRVCASAANAIAQDMGGGKDSGQAKAPVQCVQKTPSPFQRKNTVENLLSKMRAEIEGAEHQESLVIDHDRSSLSAMPRVQEADGAPEDDPKGVLPSVRSRPYSSTQIGFCQPDETSRRSHSCECHDEGAMGSYYLGTSQETVVESKKKNGNSAESSREIESQTERVRKARCDFSPTSSFAVPLHGGFQFLGRPVHIGAVQEPGLYLHTPAFKASDSGARSLLAPRCKESTTGAERLRESWLAVPDHLGRRTVGYVDEDACFEFHWFDVERIEISRTVEVYDLVNATPYPNFFANGVLVHNCPYACTFCAWGQAALSDLRSFPIERIFAELEWFGQHKVDYLDNADANFGIIKRDVEIAHATANTKRCYGYPRTFRTSFAKNSNEVIWEIANILHDADMLKSVTLAMQSMDDGVLINIKRKNIKHDKFESLVKRYEDAGIPTYTELILGLPGETLDQFVNGIEKNLVAGQHSGLFVYINLMLNNTEQYKPEYITAHGLKMLPLKAMLSHGTPDDSAVREIQPVVVETAAMSHADWKRGWLYSKVIEVFHSQGLLQDVARGLHDERGIAYRHFYSELINWLEKHHNTVAGQEVRHMRLLLERVLTGGLWDCVDPRLGDISWPPEEFAFARICLELDRFYDEVRGFLTDQGVEDKDSAVQRLVLARPGNDTATWAREIVWYGRRGKGAKKRRAL